MNPALEAALRAIPQVDELLRAEALAPLFARYPRASAVDAVRAALVDARERICGATLDEAGARAATSPEAVAVAAEARLLAKFRAFTGRAINATGIILHTGLGRAPLCESALRAIREELQGYAVLEVDRATGERNEREEGVERLLQELTGCEAATVVNNNAGATLLALAALARGREVVVARGQLVEIGGSFRIPDVMRESGARLREVGTTNRVHAQDYEAAIGPETALLLRVHPSNFRVVGFTAEVPLAELVAIGARRGLPVMEDLGSGNLVDLTPYGFEGEPLVQDCVRAGADVVTFSGDKLLGGPQAGLLAGRRGAIERCRRHPLFRALRPDKLCLVGLEATLKLFLDPATLLDRHPTLRLIALPLAPIEARARALAERLRGIRGLDAEVREDFSQTGSGSLPTERLPTRVVSIAAAAASAQDLAARLRLGDPPVFGRVHKQRLHLDLRTILDGEEDAVVSAVAAACR